MYTIIGSVKNRAFRVAWALEELGQPYEFLPAMPRSPEVTAHYSAGKLPVLLDGDAALTDSVAILTYLADKHAGLTHPAGTLARGQQDGHTQFIVDEMDMCLWTAARHSFVLPEEMRVPAVKDSLKWEYERALGRLEERLGDGPFLMGETLTVPDLVAVHCLRWARNAKFPEPSARITDYAERLTSRPAYRAALKR